MSAKSKIHAGKGAVELLEEAFHLLRLMPRSVVAFYFVGTIPFVLGFLYFWADMSWSAFAEQRASQAALIVALLFLWMKCWQAAFTAEVREQLEGNTHSTWTFQRIVRLVFVQCAIQPSGLFILPVALVATIPFGWTYAFYQNVTAAGDGHVAEARNCLRKAIEQSRLWAGQNHTALSILAIFALLIFINVIAAIIFVPSLLKMFFGIETVFTRSGTAVFNTTLLASAVALTYLCVDPIVKVVYALRCFYGASITSGEDLKVELVNAAKAAKLVATICVSLMGFGFAVRAGSAVPVVTNVSSSVSSTALNDSIEKIIQRREYSWRLPREHVEKTIKEKGWFENFLDGVREMVMGWLRSLRDLGREFFEWLGKFLSKQSFTPPKASFGSGWMTAIKVSIFVLIILVVLAILFLFWRMWIKRRRTKSIVAATAVVAQPNLADENIVADQLPEDGWLTMARELMEKGDLRLALRALYLASLAHLAQREIVQIARFKSNRDYETEVRRRARAQPEVTVAFSENVGAFDRAWYGMHDVTREALQEFQSNLDRIRAC